MLKDFRPVIIKIRQVQPPHIPLPLKLGDLPLGKMAGVTLDNAELTEIKIQARSRWR